MATNATNHFLYSNPLAIILPWLPGPLPEQLLIVNIVFSLLSLWQFYKLAFLLSNSERAALMAMLLQALAFTWWRQTEIVEVYTSGTFLLLCTLNPLIYDLKYRSGNLKLYNFKSPGRPKSSFQNVNQVSFLYGLTLILHIQHILVFPLFAWYLFRGGNRKQILSGAFVLFLTTSILWISPLVWHKHDFKAIFFDTYLSKSWLIPPFEAILKNSYESVFYLFYNFHLFIPLIGIGIWLSLRRLPEITILLIVSAGLYWAYCLRAVLGDTYVFYLVPNTILALFSVFAFQKLLRLKPAFQKWGPVLMFVIPPLFYVTAWQLGTKIPVINSYGHRKDYKGGLRYLMCPWMNNNPDLIYNTNIIYYQRIVPDNFIEFYWNYKAGVEYITGKPDTLPYKWDMATERLITPILPVFNPTGNIDLVLPEAKLVVGKLEYN